MIDVRLIRTDYEGVRAALARRHSDEVLAALERAAALDVRLRDITSERDTLRARVNESVEAGRRAPPQRRQPRPPRPCRTESRAIGGDEKQLADEHDEVSEALRQELLVIPNLPASRRARRH